MITHCSAVDKLRKIGIFQHGKMKTQCPHQPCLPLWNLEATSSVCFHQQMLDNPQNHLPASPPSRLSKPQSCSQERLLVVTTTLLRGPRWGQGPHQCGLPFFVQGVICLQVRPDTRPQPLFESTNSCQANRRPVSSIL